MNINFVSRAEIKKMLESGMIDKDNTVVISVSDTLVEWSEMFEKLHSCYYKQDAFNGSFLCLQFADDETSMKESDSNKILSFIKQHGTKKNYLVHCFAGISRSGAIAKFINEYYDAGNWYLEDYKGYNRHVFNMLHKAAGTSLAAYYEELEKQDRKYGWEEM